MTRDRQPPIDPRERHGDDDAIPDPDAPATTAEKGRARAFGELIDRAIAGRGMPAAMSADDRALVEVATVIRGAAGKLELDPSRAASLIDAALVAAVDKDRPKSASMPVMRIPPPAPAGAGEPRAASPMRARRRVLPWAIAAVSSAVAAAAVVLLVIHPPARTVAARAPIPEAERSRPADDLVGAIARERSGDAATRIDAIYADRLDGYRELALARAAHKRGAR